MVLQLDAYLGKLSELCAAFGVKRLDLFGSASRVDFDPRQSDLDLLVDFGEPYPPDAFDRYFGLKEALEQLFQRPVDLVEERAIRNPYFRQAVERDRVRIYEAGSQKTLV